MTSEQPLQQLEARLNELLEISTRLRHENHALHSREAKLLDERAQLLKKNDMARSKVEAIISRLRALEQES
jgi:cell division protein ZapB